MFEQAGPELDREIVRSVFGEDRLQTPPYSTENCAADLLLWSIAQASVAFKVQELDGVHYCILWRGSSALRQGAVTESAPSRSLAICRAVLRLYAKSPRLAALRPAGQPHPGRSGLEVTGVPRAFSLSFLKRLFTPLYPLRH